MKFVALVSGGKDSLYSIVECLRQGHELVACVHLARPTSSTPSKKVQSGFDDRGGGGDDDAAPLASQEDEDQEVVEESYMYQTAASEAVAVQVEQCLQVPLILHPRTGRSINTALVYQQPHSSGSSPSSSSEQEQEEEDEVEDLFRALQRAQQQFPTVQAVSSGAILSTYQRTRVENVCQRLGLTSLSYLWRQSTQSVLLQKMLDDGLTAVLVRCASPPGLVPRRHLQQTLQQLQPHLATLLAKYQFHVCGEGGEYETLVLDCPYLFRKRLVLDKTTLIESVDGVGELRIDACHAEPKADSELSTLLLHPKPQTVTETDQPGVSSERSLGTEQTSHAWTPPTSNSTESVSSPSSGASIDPSTPSARLRFSPHVRRVKGGLWRVSEMMSTSVAVSPTTTTTASREHVSNLVTEEELAVREARQILRLFGKILQQHHCTALDVVMVHVYLSEISHFRAMNQSYRDFFGVEWPPSRSCVAVGRHVLPGGRRVLMEALVQCGSGQYLRSASIPASAAGASAVVSTNTDLDDGDERVQAQVSAQIAAQRSQSNPYTTAALANVSSRLRQVLHVQSISHWAPVCIGPYSQVNTIRSSLHFLAGQIGLVPGSMTLRGPTWIEQLEQSWKNVASVLDALDSTSLEQLLSCLIYVSHSVDITSQVLVEFEAMCRRQIDSNAGLDPGAIDGVQVKTLIADYDGYEDEETMRELASIKDGAVSQESNRGIPILLVAVNELPMGASVEIEGVAATRCAANALELSSDFTERTISLSPIPDWHPTWDTGHDFVQGNDDQTLDLCVRVYWRSLGTDCVTSAIVTATWSEGKCDGAVEGRTILERMLQAIQRLSSDTLHLCLYHVVDRNAGGDGPDGSELRWSLWTAVAAHFRVVPAVTVIPVSLIRVLNGGENGPVGPSLALHALAVDPVRTETREWLQKARGM